MRCGPSIRIEQVQICPIFAAGKSKKSLLSGTRLMYIIGIFNDAVMLMGGSMLMDELKEMFAEAYTQGHKDGCDGLYLCPYFALEQLIKKKESILCLTQTTSADDDKNFH
jgi:hypothetical protein